MKQINYKLNNIRAIAIFIVVFGHSIILYSSQWNIYTSENSSFLLDLTKKFIDLFQMPLFFSLSGYLYASSTVECNNFMLFLKKKIQRIIFPFIFVGVGWMIPIKFALGYPEYNDKSYLSACVDCLLNRDSGHLWYLPTLFLMFILFGCLKMLNVFKKPIGMIGVFILFFMISIYWFKFPTFSIPYISNFYQYSWAFGFGICLSHLQFNVVWGGSITKILLLIISIIIGLIDTAILNRRDILFALFILCAIYLIVPNKYSVFADKISKNSFGIYLFHSPLIYITFTYFSEYPIWFVIFMNLVVFGSIAYILTVTVRKLKLGIIIGESNKK